MGLLVAGCTAAPAMVPTYSGVTAVTDASLSADGRTVTLVIRGADSPSSGAACTGNYKLKSYEVDGSVITAVGWSETFHRADTIGCALVELVCCEYKFDVPIDPPFSVAELRVPNSTNSRFPFLHKLLVRPPTVPILVNVNGWRLARESSTLAPTAQWQQTYVPTGAPSDGPERLELDAALDGPVVSGGEPGSHTSIVTVNGAKAALISFPDTGELQLVWKLGGVSLALTETRTEFGEDDMIAMAESAVTGSP